MGKGLTAIKKLFPKRRPETHKGDYGRVFILAGSEGMLGAGILCSRGALRAGAGLVYLAVPRSVRDVVNIATPEVIVVGADRVRDFCDMALKADAVAIGPGLGLRRTIAKDLLFHLNKHKYNGPVIVDADGLFAYTEFASLTMLNLILTPHPGEMARLMGRTTAEVQKERKRTALEAARKWNSVVVLKGHATVIADSRGKVLVNRTGNPGMATAGAGDVLTGMIAGLAAQGLSPWNAAVSGVYFHGLAGDLAAKEKGEYGMIASDLIEKIPYAIQKIRNHR